MSDGSSTRDSQFDEAARRRADIGAAILTSQADAAAKSLRTAAAELTAAAQGVAEAVEAGTPGAAQEHARRVLDEAAAVLSHASTLRAKDEATACLAKVLG